jgi:hypothetical protein
MLDGLLVPEGTRLVGGVIPYPASAAAPGAASWTAVLEVPGDPLDMLEDFAAQAGRLGMGMTVPGGCAPAGDDRPECATCTDDRPTGGAFSCGVLAYGEGRQLHLRFFRSAEPARNYALLTSDPSAPTVTVVGWAPSLTDPVPRPPQLPAPPREGEELFRGVLLLPGSVALTPVIREYVETVVLQLDDPEMVDDYIRQIEAVVGTASFRLDGELDGSVLRTARAEFGAGGGDISITSVTRTDGSTVAILRESPG